MTSRILAFAAMLALVLLFSKCNNLQQTKLSTSKISTTDPFSKTVTPSQEFEIDTKKDNVVEAKGGTIAVFPKGCFKNEKGDIVEGNVKIELAEALSLGDMLLSNLTTTSNGKPLVTGGMLYFNATLNGEQLAVNKDIPVYFEVPTRHRDPGMMVYKGTRDSNGNMNWTAPKELEKFLVTVDINLLDFLPEHFAQAVAAGMPYKNYKTATKELIDSLYYLLAEFEGAEAISGFSPTNINEAYYNIQKQVKDGKYTDHSYIVDEGTDSMRIDTARAPGINPLSIKTIQSEKYQNTFIATREFEERLKHIFQTCDQSVLELYINNLNKNLYVIDSMVVKLLETKVHENERSFNLAHQLSFFEKFAAQRLTNVRDAGKFATALRGYYEQQMRTLQKDLEDKKQKVVTALKEKNDSAKKLVNEYSALLAKREGHRMEKYGFTWTETGWINIDNGTSPKPWGPAPLEIKVDNGKDYDRVYVYVVYLSMKSIYRLNTNDHVTFHAGNDNDASMLMPKSSEAVIVSIGYKGDILAIAIKKIVTAEENNHSMSLETTTMEKLKEELAPFEWDYVNANSITVDLKYMTDFYLEELRQQSLIKERDFFLRLWEVAHPWGH